MKSPGYLPKKIRPGEPLAPRTTFQIGGSAAYYAEVDNTTDLSAVLDWARRTECPVYPLGGGSNILVADDGVEALVLRLLDTDEFGAIEFKENDPATVQVGAALGTADLVAKAAERGYGGLEFLAGVPGSVGGAIATNAGGHLGRVESVLEGFDGMPLDAADDKIYRLTRSRDTDEFIVLRADFKLEKKTPEEVRTRTEEVLSRRHETQPQGVLSAGCIFRNPRSGGRSAGGLIEGVGLKGARRGGAVVSRAHANWIVNAGEGTALDVVSLALMIIEQVREEFGIQLAFEIDLWGESLEEFLLREGYLV